MPSVDTAVEGIGCNRLTHNLDLRLFRLDDAASLTDEEAVRMSKHLVLHDGLFLGLSSAVNFVCIYQEQNPLMNQYRCSSRQNSSQVQKG